MSENEPTIYPTLPESAQAEVQALIDTFKETMRRACEATLSTLYTDVALWIESDAWGNFRNSVVSGMSAYGDPKIRESYDFVKIRQAILVEHRAEIIEDLNQDMVKEIERLKSHIQWLEEARNARY